MAAASGFVGAAGGTSGLVAVSAVGREAGVAAGVAGAGAGAAASGKIQAAKTENAIKERCMAENERMRMGIFKDLKSVALHQYTDHEENHALKIA